MAPFFASLCVYMRWFHELMSQNSRHYQTSTEPQNNPCSRFLANIITKHSILRYFLIHPYTIPEVWWSRFANFAPKFSSMCVSDVAALDIKCVSIPAPETLYSLKIKALSTHQIDKVIRSSNARGSEKKPLLCLYKIQLDSATFFIIWTWFGTIAGSKSHAPYSAIRWALTPPFTFRSAGYM